MDICIDFDGTCVTHEFPKVGKDIGAVPVLKELVENGHNLILFTMRSNGKDGKFLDDAINWFKANGIKLYGIQTNPSQITWTTSPKAYGQLYIDDAALGCPCYVDISKENDGRIQQSGRRYVNWEQVREMLILMDVIKEKE